MASLSTLISAYLADAGNTRSRDEVRALRGTLAHVIAADLSLRDAEAVRGRDVDAFVRDLLEAGVAPDRAAEVVHGLRSVYAHGVERGLIAASPLVGFAPTRTAPPSPTTAVLAFSERVAHGLERMILLAFALTLVALVVVIA